MRREYKSIEEGLYRFVLYDNGDIAVFSDDRIMVDSSWDELDEFQLNLLRDARRSLDAA